MKTTKKGKGSTKALAKEDLFRRNPMPYGDVRKYYLGAKLWTVILFVLCTYISVAAIALRTDSCEQLPNALIFGVMFGAFLSIVGHYMRSYLGYGISAFGSLLVLILLQTYHGTGVSLISNNPAYGENFVKGIQSIDFWIILSKVFAILQLALSFVFINSTRKVKEEPKAEGMNVQIERFRAWLNRINDSLTPGRRPLDYWFVAGSLLCAMAFIAYNPSMARYDYYALAALLVGCVMIACKLPLAGAGLIAASALLRCTMYQYRFGMSIPTASAYAGMWLSILYFYFASAKDAKEASFKKQGILNIIESVQVWIPVAFLAAIYPVHEFLSVFSGSHMNAEKDSLPLLMFLPLLILLAVRSCRWYGYALAGGFYIWFWDALRHSTPRADNALVFFDCADCHGSVGAHTTEVLMSIVDALAVATIAMAILSVCMAVIILVIRGAKHETK